MIRLSSNDTVSFVDCKLKSFAVIEALGGATSAPVPHSRSQTQILPFNPRLTHRPSARAKAVTGLVWPYKVRTKFNLGGDAETEFD